MKYTDLKKRDKGHLNGKIAQFMDAYIRQHKVWTPKQMHSDFFEKTESEFKNKWFTHETIDSTIKWSSESAISWLITETGRDFVMDRFIKKYNKDRPIADRKSPLVERVRFGISWDKTKYFDINFGLKDGFHFIETQELENITVFPWTIEHVNNELETKYDTDLLYCLIQLSTSHLEKLFVEKWIDRFYDNYQYPAIIPEICGFRSKFYYYEFQGEIYTSIHEIPGNYMDNFNDIKTTNFRYDFLIANFKKQNIAFIELDGFEYHKSREQQTIDSIKRNSASKYGISLLTFTSKRIINDIDSVFNELEEFLNQ